MAKKKKTKNSKIFQILIIVFVLMSILFSALAVIFAIGMIPTLVSLIVDRTKDKIRTLTIASMNFAGCVPFAVEVFNKGNNIETAITYIAEPRTIVVIYFAAAMGYLIDWAVTGIVSSMALQKAKKRLLEIEQEKNNLVERWGLEVSGTIPIDEYGFPLVSDNPSNNIEKNS